MKAKKRKQDPLARELRGMRRAFMSMASAFGGLLNASMINTKKLNELLEKHK